MNRVDTPDSHRKPIAGNCQLTRARPRFRQRVATILATDSCRPAVLMLAATLGWFAATPVAQAAPPASTVTDAWAAVPKPHAAGVWALSVTSPDGQRNILVGSMHVEDPHLRQPDPRLIRQARVVVTEHPGFGGGAVAATPWRQALSPTDIDMLRLRLRCRLAGQSDAFIEHVLELTLAQATPVAANQLAYERCSAASYEARDTIVTQAQFRYQRPVATLETDAEVVAIEKRVAWDTTGRGIHFALSNEATILQADVVDALNDGDYAKVDAALRQSLTAVGMAYEPYYNAMVRERNLNWMRTLPPLLDAGGAFVLVGAEHLPGRDGLIILLRKRGYTVQPVQLPAGAGTTAETYNLLPTDPDTPSWRTSPNP